MRTVLGVLKPRVVAGVTGVLGTEDLVVDLRSVLPGGRPRPRPGVAIALAGVEGTATPPAPLPGTIGFFPDFKPVEKSRTSAWLWSWRSRSLA